MVNNVSPMPLEIQFPRIVDKHLRQEWTLDFPAGANWQQNWDDYVETVRAFCDICEDANVVMSWNHTLIAGCAMLPP